MDRFITLWEMAGEVVEDPIIKEATAALKAGGGSAAGSRDAAAIARANASHLIGLAIMPPIMQMSTFVQEALGVNKGYEYARGTNPTRQALERNVASLEAARHGFAFSSGMGCLTSLMMLFKAGDHIVCGENVYGGTYRLFDKIYRNFGLTFSFVDTRDPQKIEDAMTPQTVALVLETPTNPLMRITDLVIALPFLLFMILFRIAFGVGPGESGVFPMLVALVALSWTSSARLVRGQILQLRESEYVQAARLLGARTGYLLLRHLVPNTIGVILVYLTFAIPSTIFTEAFLSFIGMGVVPPTPSWGSLCDDGMKSFLVHPHEFLVPAVFISITVLAFNLLGDGLRDALDPKMRGRE